MIFLTVGSHEPFDRLIKAVDQWAGLQQNPDVFAQITAKGKYKPQNMRTVDYMTEQAYRDACAKADLLIAHAGMGSIITALTYQKPIVIMPRSGKLGETRNDHQIATAACFRGRPGICIADDEVRLPDAINLALQVSHQESNPGPYAQPKLLEFLKDVFSA